MQSNWKGVGAEASNSPPAWWSSQSQLGGHMNAHSPNLPLNSVAESFQVIMVFVGLHILVLI
jgi:hypothetical protein